MAHASYLKGIFLPAIRSVVIDEMCYMLRNKKKDFDSIACRGVSMLTIGSIMAHKLKKQIVVIRKGESCHSNYTTEFFTEPKSYIIVDDLISSGKTIEAVVESLPNSNHYGTILYRDIVDNIYAYNKNHPWYTNKGNLNQKIRQSTFDKYHEMFGRIIDNEP